MTWHGAVPMLFSIVPQDLSTPRVDAVPHDDELRRFEIMHTRTSGTGYKSVDPGRRRGCAPSAVTYQR